MIPREMPAFADRQSIHWPGFNVHRDTHISISKSDYITHASDLLSTPDVDDLKENVRPRKRARRRVTLDEGEMVRPITTERQAWEADDFAIMLTPSPGNRAMTPREKKQERKQMKFIMVSEMDEEEHVDDQL